MIDEIDEIDNLGKIENSVSKISILPFISLFFFTVWGLCLQALYYFGILRKYQFSILLTSIMISLGGFIITYIEPKYIYLPYIDIKLSGKFLMIIDILVHHLPLLGFIMRYDTNIKRDSGILFLLMIIVYLILFNPFKIYNFLVKKCQRKSN